MQVKDRFIKYVQVPTTSDESVETCPSTQGQRVFGEMLAEELKAMGLKEVAIDPNGYVMATLPANTDRKVPSVGFIAHLDTAPDLATEGIRPRVVEGYDGGEIVLNEELNVLLSPEDFPSLLNYVGQDLVVTDGTTLLGADDKAGVAAIMTAVEHLLAHPEIEHGDIRIGFTPDEEIGRGADFFNVAAFGADYAYTVDGGEIGELEFESFNAANAKILFNGRNVHPGYAKGRMRSALEMAHVFHGMLPSHEQPQYTEGYEGFFHRTHLSGDVDGAEAKYIIRDHDRNLFEKRKKQLADAAALVDLRFGEGSVQVEMKDMYYNMGEKVKEAMFMVDLAVRAMEEAGVKPLIMPIRGGTDGSKLSFMGLPCPNIFAGGHNFHGRHEYVPVRSMEKAVEVIVGIARLFGEMEKAGGEGA